MWPRNINAILNNFLFAKYVGSNSELLLSTVTAAICSTLHRYNYVTTTQTTPVAFVTLHYRHHHIAHISCLSEKSDVKDKKERVGRITTYFQQKEARLKCGPSKEKK